MSSGKTLLEGPILGLPGLIEEEPAEQARTGAGSRSEPGISADRANYRAAAGADGRAGQRALSISKSQSRAWHWTRLTRSFPPTNHRPTA